jgi:hypothetical protein
VKHRVIWLDQAIAHLAKCYETARRTTGQDADVMHASGTASMKLLQDPMECSESRAGDLRIVRETPLTIYFQIRETEMGPTVFVEQCFYRPPLKRP